jgi:hypothetical protein
MSKSGTITNSALTVVAALLGVIAVQNAAGPTAPSTASAAQPGAQFAGAGPESDPDEGAGRVSAAEQRKTIIAELRTISRRLDQLESQLAKGIKVTEMPEIKLPNDLARALRDSARDQRTRDASQSKDAAQPKDGVQPAADRPK